MNNDSKKDKEKDEHHKPEDKNSVYENSHTKITWTGGKCEGTYILKTWACNSLDNHQNYNLWVFILIKIKN